MKRNNGGIQWNPKVSQAKIRWLYENDAHGIAYPVAQTLPIVSQIRTLDDKRFKQNYEAFGKARIGLINDALDAGWPTTRSWG